MKVDKTGLDGKSKNGLTGVVRRATRGMEPVERTSDSLLTKG